MVLATLFIDFALYKSSNNLLTRAWKHVDNWDFGHCVATGLKTH